MKESTKLLFEAAGKIKEWAKFLNVEGLTSDRYIYVGMPNHGSLSTINWWRAYVNLKDGSMFMRQEFRDFDIKDSKTEHFYYNLSMPEEEDYEILSNQDYIKNLKRLVLNWNHYKEILLKRYSSEVRRIENERYLADVAAERKKLLEEKSKIEEELLISDLKRFTV